MSIVDAHFHVWRQADLPWLMGPMQPRIFGAYDPIRRDYPMAEYLADLAGTGVTRAVYVQANWPTDRAMDEAEWIASLNAKTGWPHATVAYADMTDPDAARALDRLAQIPLVRGIRQQLHWHQTPEYRFAAHDDLCRDATVQRNVARLADYGFSFDLQVFAGQMAGAVELAQAAPKTTLVLQHAGMLEDTSDAGRTAWRTAMAKLAQEPNVTSKLSGFGTFIHRCDADHIAWQTRETLALFGADRCLWGSNFPIEKLWTDYATLLNAHQTAAADLPPQDQAAIFNDTATRVYRLN